MLHSCVQYKQFFNFYLNSTKNNIIINFSNKIFNLKAQQNYKKENANYKK